MSRKPDIDPITIPDKIAKSYEEERLFNQEIAQCDKQILALQKQKLKAAKRVSKIMLNRNWLIEQLQ